MKGGIYSLDGSEVCEHSMDVTIDDDDEPPTKKVHILLDKLFYGTF